MQSQQVVHEFTQTNDAPPEKVFPLLCPVREADWVPDWRYRLVHSRSGVAELGCVFTTPNEDGSETVWTCVAYDPPRGIRYAWVWPQMIATLLEIEVRLAPEARSQVHIRYRYTALSEAGARELGRYDRAWFEAKMRGWESAINHYLRTGKKIAAEGWE